MRNEKMRIEFSDMFREARTKISDFLANVTNLEAIFDSYGLDCRLDHAFAGDLDDILDNLQQFMDYLKEHFLVDMGNLNEIAQEYISLGYDEFDEVLRINPADLVKSEKLQDRFRETALRLFMEAKDDRKK